MDTLLLFLSFAGAVALTWASSPDDAFISLRYAHNLLAGKGLVFNPGQRVDGTTSVTGLVIAVVALAVPLGAALLKAKLLSLGLMCLALERGRKLLQYLSLPSGLYSAGCFLLGASPVLGFAAANGLATSAGCYAVTGLLVELCSGRAYRHPRFATTFAILVVLSHPEGPLLVAATGTWALATERSARLWHRVSWGVGAALTELAVLGASTAYFGSPVPNTYFAKQVALPAALRSGAAYLLGGVDTQLLSPTGGTEHLLTLLVLGVDLLTFVGFVAALANRSRSGYLAAAVGAQATFVLLAGGDWMHGARFLAPVEVALVGLSLIGIVEVARTLTQASLASVGSHRVCALLAGGCALTTAALYLLPGVNDPIWELRGTSNRALVAAGGYAGFSATWAQMPALLACAPPGSLVATTEAGFGPFVDESLRILDLRGLTDREIARHAPAKMKFTYGVADEGWESPGSFVGRVILRERPVLIATLDGQPARAALGGRYVLLGATIIGASSSGETFLSVYAARGRRLDCRPESVRAMLERVGRELGLPNR